MVPDRRVRVEHPISHLNCQRRCGQPSNISLACGSQMAIRSTSSKLLTSTHRALRRRQLLLRHAWRATSLEALARSICARLVVLMPAARLLHSPGRFLLLETVRNPVLPHIYAHRGLGRRRTRAFHANITSLKLKRGCLPRCVIVN